MLNAWTSQCERTANHFGWSALLSKCICAPNRLMRVEQASLEFLSPSPSSSVSAIISRSLKRVVVCVHLMLDATEHNIIGMVDS